MRTFRKLLRKQIGCRERNHRSHNHNTVYTQINARDIFRMNTEDRPKKQKVINLYVCGNAPYLAITNLIG